MAAYAHQPVMVDEVTALMAAVPAGVAVDATVGGGGHARALLEARDDLTLVGLDQDPDAVAAAAEVLRPFGARITLRRARFDYLSNTMVDLGIDEVVAVLFDLGVSSPQVDRPERGFSYRAEGPLDMRMDPSTARSAADVVNGYPEAELARVLRRHGDERHAARIARAVVAARPLATTTELADVVRAAIPAPARRRGGDPAKRTFQAVRIEVNTEIDVLGPALGQAVAALAPGGRCAALAYHSGEDRVVKERFRHAATGGCTCPPGLPCACGATPVVRLLKRGAWRPGAAEVAANRRAAGARLRAVEKLAGAPGTAP